LNKRVGKINIEVFFQGLVRNYQKSEKKKSEKKKITPMLFQTHLFGKILDNLLIAHFTYNNNEWGAFKFQKGCNSTQSNYHKSTSAFYSKSY